MPLNVGGTNITAVKVGTLNITEVKVDGSVKWTSAVSPLIADASSGTVYIPTNTITSMRLVGGGTSGGIGFNVGSTNVGGDTVVTVYDALTNSQLDRFSARGGYTWAGGANGAAGVSLGAGAPSIKRAEDGYSDCNRTSRYSTGGTGTGAGGGGGGGVNGRGNGGSAGSVLNVPSKTYSGSNGLKIVYSSGRAGYGNKSCGGSFPSQYVRQAGNGAPGGVYITW